MSDESPDPKLFTLTEAERTRVQIEPVLIEAMLQRRKLGEVDNQLMEVAQRVAMLGGVLVTSSKVAGMRHEHSKLTAFLRRSIESIEATGCVVKDLDAGLLDFPAILDNEEVYLCWRVGEDRIRFYHRRDEGFDGRKPLDPRDAGPTPPIH
jgi:hypothetical protein